MPGYRDEGKYTPPSLRGSIAYTPTTGEARWGGGAVDPTTQTYVINSSNVAQVYKLMTREDYNEQVKKLGRAAALARIRLALCGAHLHLPQPLGDAVLESALRHHVRL